MSNFAFIAAVSQQLLGLLFLIAGSSKMANRYELSATMIAGGIHSPWVVKGVSYALPWVEILCGGFLVVGFQPQLALGAVGLCLIGFTVFLGINLATGNRFACHCFGSLSRRPTTWWAVGRNLGLLALSALIYWAYTVPQIRPAVSLTSLLVAGAGVVAGLILSAAHALILHRSGEAP
jgi:putative oxidoreductase